MGDGWEIREGGREDLDALEPLWRSMYEHHAEVSTGSVPFVPADERWPVRLRGYERAVEDGKAVLLLAEASGKIVGFAFSSLLDPDPVFVSGPIAELDTLVVAPECRGQGIGEALAERSLAALRERGVETVKVVVVAGNEGALRLYNRLGIDPALIELMAPL